MSLGYLEKKIFPDVPDLPDLARSGQIWPDLGRLGKFFFQKKKIFFPDLARSGRPRSGDLARSGSIRVLSLFKAFPRVFLQKKIKRTQFAFAKKKIFFFFEFFFFSTTTFWGTVST